MAVEPARDIDPFTVEIVKDSLIAIGDEMFVALQRTSKSPIIYEVLDFGSGLADANGQLITQGNGVTVFIGTLTHAVRHTLGKFGPEGLEPGDVVMTNDPYTGGGTHLPDMTLVVPIFHGGDLVAFAASKAHWTEVGGKDPGSWTTDSTEILLGDMHAQAAALRLGERRFHELCDKYGIGVVLGSMDALLDYGEPDDAARARAPAEGRLRGGHDDRRRRPRQRPVPGAGDGDDHRRRVRLRLHRHAPPGAGAGQLHGDRTALGIAERPAPVSTYWETRNYVSDLVWKALAPAVPDRLSAGRFPRSAAR